eukprot:TRINITY_DN2823_c0_g1_i1.p1 TRINITY_DN2823_c0_g1~~TRINITY_DN2823_c0_g1_i1.p1  ORF type:complete len:213 (-),score=-25.07 TRINITY_DN2823_c0_g1_i1:2-640(-)
MMKKSNKNIYVLLFNILLVSLTSILALINYKEVVTHLITSILIFILSIFYFYSFVEEKPTIFTEKHFFTFLLDIIYLCEIKDLENDIGWFPFIRYNIYIFACSGILYLPDHKKNGLNVGYTYTIIGLYTKYLLVHEGLSYPISIVKLIIFIIISEYYIRSSNIILVIFPIIIGLLLTTLDTILYFFIIVGSFILVIGIVIIAFYFIFKKLGV